MLGLIVIILAACAAMFVMAVVVGLVLPLRALVNVQLLGNQLKLDGMVAWATPWVFSVVLADAQSAPRFRVLGFRLKSRDSDSAEESDPDSWQTTPSWPDRNAIPVDDRPDVEASIAEPTSAVHRCPDPAPKLDPAPQPAEKPREDRASSRTAPRPSSHRTTRKHPAARRLKRGLFGLRRRLRRLQSHSKQGLAWRLLRQSALRGALLRWALRGARMLLRLVAFDRLKVHMRVGLGDPAAMGQLFGYWKAIEYGLGLPQKRSFDLSIVPFFDRGEFLEVEGTVQIHTSVARLLAPIAVWLFTFPYLAMFHFMWSESNPKEKMAAPRSPGVFAW